MGPVAVVVDSSALVCIVLGEPDAAMFERALVAADQALLPAVGLLESSIVVLRRRGPKGVTAFDELRERLAISLVAVDAEQAFAAREAFVRFGKGRHPASLNSGDCFSYALAKTTGRSLLFKGEDFAQTDVLAAL